MNIELEDIIIWVQKHKNEIYHLNTSWQFMMRQYFLHNGEKGYGTEEEANAGSIVIYSPACSDLEKRG